MMKNEDIIISDEQLDALIQRYFDAETSLEEEALLKRAVAHREEPRYDEIRAVLGFMAAKRRSVAKKRKRGTTMWLQVAAVAAVAALVVTVGINLTHQATETGTCYAMVGGVRIDDESQVLSLMQSNLGDIGDAASETSMSVESQIADIASVINEAE